MGLTCTPSRPETVYFRADDASLLVIDLKIQKKIISDKYFDLKFEISLLDFWVVVSEDLVGLRVSDVEVDVSAS